ncbi:MAG: hypothetical protein E7384_00170 [Ruminococcaceae bacterium]|nr:hypothetical protein [Oscillospiraceae bacterium]
MATLKIVTGRAGTGKSSYCIEQMAEYIKNRSGDIGGAPAYLIVPEQFAVNSEKRLMTEACLPGLMIDEVLSFKRAACRVLGRLGGLKYELLSPSGKIMILTQAVRNLSSELEFYGGYATKPRGMESLLSLIDEFGRYGATSEKLTEIAGKEDTDNLLKIKLSDISKIYSEYRKLTEGKFYDSETLYRDFIKELPGDVMFKNSHVWIDGFNGFTAQEFEIIAVLLTVCEAMCISLCADQEDRNLFDNSNGTYRKLKMLAENIGVKPETMILCDGDVIPPRFKNNKYLAHLEKNYGKYPLVKLYGSDTRITVCECQNRYYEAEEVALRIKKLVSEGYSYGDIVVVAGSNDIYKNIIGAALTSKGIPYFIDEKRQISSHPLVRYTVGLMELISSNWSYISVFNFLKTGLYEKNMSVVDILENIVLAKGIKGRSGVKGWSKFVEKCKAEIAEASAKGHSYRDNIAADVLAVKLFNDIETFREKIKLCKSVSDCCDEIINFLVKNDVYESVSEKAAELRKEGRLDSADEYSRIWNIVLEVLNQADMFLGDKEIRGVNIKSQYIADILANGFAQYRAGFIPHSGECVQVGTPERSKSLNPKVMILLGANEGVFPSTIKDNGLLTDSDREMLLRGGVELSDDNKKRALYADFVMYTVLTTPSEKMIMTYAIASSSGDALRPSSAVRKILSMFPDVSVEVCNTDFIKKSRGEKNTGSRDFFESDTSISGDIAEKVLGFESDKAVLSVSRLNTYNGCPYSYLLQYCFRLKPRKEFKIEATDTGTLQHGLIENAFREITDGNASVGPMSYEECSDVVDSVFDKVMEQIGEVNDTFCGSERNLYLTSRVKDIAKKELKNLVGQLAHNHLKPVLFEANYGEGKDCIMPPVEVECNDGFKVLVGGKIDRIDAGLLKTSEEEDAKVYFRVIDYKSSQKDISLSDIVNGKELQLIVYIAAAEAGLDKLPAFNGRKTEPASAFYYGFEKSNIELEKRHTGEIDALDKEHYMSGLFLAKENAMEALHGGVYKVTSNSVKNKNAVPPGGFEKLVGEAKRNIAETADSMRAGEFPAKPFAERGNVGTCSYCDFKSVCRINTSNPKNVRFPEVVSPEDFWSKNSDKDN